MHLVLLYAFDRTRVLLYQKAVSLQAEIIRARIAGAALFLWLSRAMRQAAMTTSLPWAGSRAG